MPHAGSNDALYYEDVGHGHPIIFIPGFGGLGSFWTAQIEHFRNGFRAITIDQRGVGKSERTKGFYSLGQMTDDLKSVMDAAGVSDAILVGHSTGGAIAQAMAVASPERVTGLLLSSTWCKPTNYFRRVFEFRRSLLEIGAKDLFHQAGVFFRYPPAFSEEHDAAFEKTGEVDAETTIARINAILQSDLSSISSKIASPTLVVAARDDSLIPQYMSDEVAQQIPQSKYVVLDEGGHFLPETRSDEYNTLLGNFIRSLDLKTRESGRLRSAG